jgi:hypothetical protein
VEPPCVGSATPPVRLPPPPSSRSWEFFFNF